MKSFFSQLDSALVSYSWDQERVEFLSELKGYIQSGICISYKNKMQYLPLWGEKSVDVAKILGVNPGTVRGARSLMSDELYRLFGIDFFTVLEKDLKAAVRRFYVIQHSRGTKETLFIPGFSQLLPQLDVNVDVEGVGFKDCRKEAEFLKRYTKKEIEKEFAGLDQKKLCYVLSLLDGESGVKDRFNLFWYLLK